MQRLSKRMMGFTMAMLLATTSAGYAAPLKDVQEGFAKNVIVMIPDGLSQGGITLARWVYSNGESLHMDEMATGLVKTHNSDTIIADSAPAGTAIATGYKTQDKLVGVKPAINGVLNGAKNTKDSEKYEPVASILEGAKLQGKSTGIVVTSEVQHATPADFTAHAAHRGQYTRIGEQQVYQMMDVVMGGGGSYLLPNDQGSTDIQSKTRIDGENMVEQIKDLGYDYITTKEELAKSQGKKIWGTFAPKALARELDRPVEQPTLAEMTDKAIKVLSQNPKGFFLMVEGSQVDWAAHANETMGIISEVKSYDDAVGVALRYAKTNADTLVISVTDHGNSGITIGDASTSKTYPEHPLEYFTANLKKATITEEKAGQLLNKERTNIQEVMTQLGISDLTKDEVKSIKESKNPQETMADVLAKRSRIGYTTNGHTGEDVALYVYTKNENNRLSGTVNNNELADYMAKAIGIRLEEVSKKLFVSSKALSEKGYKVTIDLSDKANAVLVVEKDGKTYRLLENKNYMLDGKDKKSYNGVNVYNDIEFFIPQAAIDQMK